MYVLFVIMWFLGTVYLCGIPAVSARKVFRIYRMLRIKAPP